ncbi:hypothetical protein UFOVP707_76 [uncultured Caudovirales phage]|uniref:Uncharacterized protein n=1 Tax=uncultured Caudovirales phage TaxID=2100421 RepID=A0A6J5NHS2_9CAUD|nr:hypothetical protein UFOVP707_76 [uncultured Caudovirales phage]
MAERPILMSAPMVRAILAGTKTQTRRVVKQATGPSLSVGMDDATPGVAELSWLYGDGPGHDVHEAIKRVPCPYGKPGDLLWVREAFFHEPADYCWEASVSIPCRPASTVYRADYEGDTRGTGWKPSIHMPRALSRITLRVTDVRVERLGDISEADAVAEGIERRGPGWAWYTDAKAYTTDPRTSYRDLWESINGSGSWDANPWVWCLTFERVESGNG